MLDCVRNSGAGAWLMSDSVPVQFAEAGIEVGAVNCILMREMEEK